MKDIYNTNGEWYDVQKKRDGGDWKSVSDLYRSKEDAMRRIEDLTGLYAEEAHDDDVHTYRVVINRD